MDSKKLVKVIKSLVEVEVAKKQEQFLKTTFPKILEEEVKKRMKQTKVSKKETKDVDPFSLAEAVLEKDRAENSNTESSEEIKYTKNAILNEVLNQTAVAEPDIDKTVSFGTHNVPMGSEAPVGVSLGLKDSMAQKMGYGDLQAQGRGASPKGLGVQTGLAGLDKILNRDNTELVKAMSNKERFRPGA
tara:strand:+ start:879 stop:1442 length:564 start_codon:yes stop_codon:yes gene_type:complete